MLQGLGADDTVEEAVGEREAQEIGTQAEEQGTILLLLGVHAGKDMPGLRYCLSVQV
jgi:hypothetical protein